MRELHMKGVLHSAAMRRRLLRVFGEVVNGSRPWPGYQDMILYW